MLKNVAKVMLILCCCSIVWKHRVKSEDNTSISLLERPEKGLGSEVTVSVLVNSSDVSSRQKFPSTTENPVTAAKPAIFDNHSISTTVFETTSDHAILQSVSESGLQGAFSPGEQLWNDDIWTPREGIVDTTTTRAVSSAVIEDSSARIFDTTFNEISTDSLTPTTVSPSTFGDLKQNETSLIDMLLSSQPTSSFEQFASTCSATEGDRLCGCSTSCRVVNNCCYDSEFVETEESSLTSSVQHTCYSEFDRKWRLDSPSILIDKCTKDWPDEKFRKFCEQPNPADMQSYVPCYSSTTQLSYRNVYCLNCNGLTDCSAWELTFQAGSPVQYNYIDTFDKMSAIAGRPIERRGLQFMLSPFRNFEPAHCTPSIVRKCNPEFQTDSLTKLCHAYYSPILVDRLIYRNRHCFRCSVGVFPDFFEENIIRHSQSSLSVLLKFTNHPNSTSRTPCTTPECRPVVSKIRGYTDMYTVYAAVSVPEGSSLPNKTVGAGIIETCDKLLLKNIAGHLKGYDHAIKIEHKVYNLSFLPQFNIFITIRDEIAISMISKIQYAIRLAEFHLDVQDAISIKCCVDKDGEKIFRDENGDLERQGEENGENSSCSLCHGNQTAAVNCKYGYQASMVCSMISSLLAMSFIYLISMP